MKRKDVLALSSALLAMIVTICVASMKISLAPHPTALFPAQFAAAQALTLVPVTTQPEVQAEPALPPGHAPLFEPEDEEPSGTAPQTQDGDGLEIRTPPLSGEAEHQTTPSVEIAEKMWAEIQEREKQLELGEEELARKKMEFEELERKFRLDAEETGKENDAQAELLIEAAKEIAEHARDLAEREEALEAAKKALEEGDFEDAERDFDEFEEEEEQEEEEQEPEQEGDHEPEAEADGAAPSEGVNLNIHVNHKASGPVNMNIDVETSSQEKEDEDSEDSLGAEMKAGKKMLRQLYKTYYPGTQAKVGSSKAAQGKHAAHRHALKASHAGQEVSRAHKTAKAAATSKRSASHPRHATHAKPEGTLDFNFLGFGMKLAANVTWQPGAAAWYAYLPEDDRAAGGRLGVQTGVVACVALLVSVFAMRQQV